MSKFFASVVSFAFFVMGLRDSSVFVRCLPVSVLIPRLRSISEL